MNESYLRFDYKGLSESGKTKIYEVFSSTGVHLGSIKWYSNWRRYVLFTNSNTLFDSNCLSEISTFLKSLMDERKQGK